MSSWSQQSWIEKATYECSSSSAGQAKMQKKGCVPLHSSTLHFGRAMNVVVVAAVQAGHTGPLIIIALTTIQVVKVRLTMYNYSLCPFSVLC